jgi:hypothetical protein
LGDYAGIIISLITVKSNALLSIACKVNVNMLTAGFVKLLPCALEKPYFTGGNIAA